MFQNSSIRLLPEHLIDQIKAGEVVERPSALVKEILENSLDAKSKHIELTIIDNGLELVALEDDGQGMSFEDLPFAFARHATSKIKDYADLFKLLSYGFRGEALASIASVSRVTCTSAKSDGKGGKIEIQGGQQTAYLPIENARPGTSLYIRDLFYNTPARLNFIKSKSTEKNAIKRIVDSFLLTAKKTTFTIRYDDQDKKIFDRCQNQKDFINRMEKLFFKRKEISTHTSLMYESRREFEGHKLELHLSTMSFAGNSGKNHYLFANDRLFNEKRIHQTIIRSLPNLWGSNTGHYACFLTIPPEKIDVNVHPNKTEVKFSREDIIYAMLKDALKDLDDLAQPMSATNSPRSFEHSSTPHHEAWQKFDQNHSTPMSSTDSTENIISSPKIEVDHLPTGYRWLPNHPHCILDESALIRLCCELKHDSYATSLTPLLINEPIHCKKSDLDLEKLSQIGFDCEWIDKDLLALRAVAAWLRPLPYLTLCHHAIDHIDSSIKNIFKDLKLKTKLSESVFLRSFAQFNFSTLKESKVIVSLDENILARLFHQ